MERYARPYSAASSNPTSSRPRTPSAADRHLLSRFSFGVTPQLTVELILGGQIHTSDGVDEDVHRSSVVDLGTGVASRHQHATGGGGGQHLLTR